MRVAIRINPRIAFIVAVATLASSACSKWSSVGSLPDSPPTAVAGTIGEPFTADGSGDIHATVRAGANVVLSGSDSVRGTTAILDWKWEQTGGTPKVALIERSIAVYSFLAPQVTTTTNLTFKLSALDANGNIGTANATITVQPIQDSNQFLLYSALTRSNATYQVVATATSAVPANPAADASQTLDSFKITVSRWVHYTTQGTPQTANLEVGTPIVIQGGWPTAMGVSSNPLDPRNPRFQLDIPNLNADDVNGSATVQGGTMPNGSVSAGDQTMRLELSTINDAYVTLCATIESQTGSVQPSLVVLDNSGQVVPPISPVSICPAGSIEYPASSLIVRSATAASLDTLVSATAYYATVDSGSLRMTLSNWLKTNGWQAAPGAPDLSKADARAVYTNNYDLGLGRDMYTKIGSCDSAGQLAVGACDVSSVVINYQGIESAAKKLSPINAVAMEYRRPDGTSSGPRMVTFFAFAPNPNDPNGDFTRVNSVNLDTRGERYLPGGCTVCHGGSSAPLISTPNGNVYGHGPLTTVNGDLNAGFLSWDLDSFLFPNTDTSWTKIEDQGLRAQLTQAAQAAQFRRLNAAAYLTFNDATPNRFMLARELVEGWYQGAATVPAASLDTVLPAKDFTGSFTPTEWTGGANGNPADGSASLGSGELYQQVFARNCRACHIIQVPSQDPTSATLCSATGTTLTPATDANPQQPYGCYWAFVHGTGLTGFVGGGIMPVARRTMDRLWVSTDSTGVSAGSLLQKHLAGIPTLPPLLTPGQQPIVGRPIPTKFYAYKLDGTQDAAAATPDVNQVAQLSTSVTFAAGYGSAVAGISWSVMRCTSPGTPSSCTVPVAVSGDNSVNAAFLLAGIAPAQYLPTLALTGIDGVAAAPISFPLISVAGNPPAFVNPPSSISLAVNSLLPLVSAPGLVLQDVQKLGIHFGNGGAAQGRVMMDLCVAGVCNAASDPYVSLAPLSCVQGTCSALNLATSSLALQSGVVASPVGGSKLEVTVLDAAQHPAAVQDFAITVTGLNTPTPIQEQLGANSPQTTFCLDSKLPAPPANSVFEVVLSRSPAQLLVADLQNLTYPVPGTVASPVGPNGFASVVPCNGSTYTLGVAYTPPAGVSTATQQANISYANPDTFYYSLVIRSTAGGAVEQITSSAPIMFTITQRNAFSDVYSLLVSPAPAGLGCTGCHNSGAPFKNYDGSPVVDFSSPATDSPTLCTLFAHGGTQLRGGSTITYPVDHSPFVDVHDVLNPPQPNSGLVCMASGTCTDPNGQKMPVTFTLGELAQFQTWIADGANCP
jgi:hypothetical protein